MPSQNLWERLRQARVVQVFLVYLGASWGILQIADVLTEALALPEWVLPVAVLLLLIGLIIILATAWIQSLPSTSAAEEAGELPTDWQVAPADALASLKAGRLPHLTWGRAILGGVVALCLLFGGAGAYVLLTGVRAPGFGPVEAGADEAATGIAIVPFNVTGGSDLDLWREGMVDVLSTNLDGMGGYRTIDSRTVMARWRERVGDETTPDLRTSLEVAGSTGARYGLMGNLVGNPGGVRINADIYDLSTGDKITQSYVEGAADSVLALVGRLSVSLTRDLLAATGQQLIQAPRTAGITTNSLEALRDYLDGQAAYRRADFATAAAAFERAVDTDSTFVMAWHGLSDAYGWMENINSEVGLRASERVVALADRLPLRERTLMVAAERGLDEGDLTALDDLREAVTKYPDDPEAWFTLGEFYRHIGIPAGLATEQDEVEVIRKAVGLDPTFAPYYIHYIEGLVGAGDRAGARQALETYRSLAPTNANSHLALAVSLFLGDETERSATLSALDTVAPEALMRVWREVPWVGLDAPEETLEVYRAAFEASGDTYWLDAGSQLLMALGRTAEAVAELADLSLAPAARVNAAAGFLHLDMPVPEGLQGALEDLDVCADREDAGAYCMFMVGSVAALVGDRATWSSWVDRNRSLDETYEAEGQGWHAKEHEAIAAALEGLWALRQDDDPAGAGGLLEDAALRLPGNMGYLTRWHLSAALEAESPRQALRTLETMASGVNEGYATVRIGRVRERLGDTAGAREAYERAVRILQDADDGHPYAVEAREALVRLRG